jgi:hypothetical protein
VATKATISYQSTFLKSLIVFHKGPVEKLLVLCMCVGFFEVLFGSLTCAARLLNCMLTMYKKVKSTSVLWF